MVELRTYPTFYPAFQGELVSAKLEFPASYRGCKSWLPLSVFVGALWPAAELPILAGDFTDSFNSEFFNTGLVTALAEPARKLSKFGFRHTQII